MFIYLRMCMFAYMCAYLCMCIDVHVHTCVLMCETLSVSARVNHEDIILFISYDVWKAVYCEIYDNNFDLARPWNKEPLIPYKVIMHRKKYAFVTLLCFFVVSLHSNLPIFVRVPSLFTVNVLIRRQSSGCSMAANMGLSSLSGRTS